MPKSCRRNSKFSEEEDGTKIKLMKIDTRVNNKERNLKTQEGVRRSCGDAERNCHLKVVVLGLR